MSLTLFRSRTEREREPLRCFNRIAKDWIQVFLSNNVNLMNSPPLSNDGTDSDYGAELDFTDDALLAQLDRVQVESSAVIKQTPSSDEAAADNQETTAYGTADLETLTGLSREKLAEVLSEIEIVKIEEENRSLW